MENFHLRKSASGLLHGSLFYSQTFSIQTVYAIRVYDLLANVLISNNAEYLNPSLTRIQLYDGLKRECIVFFLNDEGKRELKQG